MEICPRCGEPGTPYKLVSRKKDESGRVYIGKVYLYYAHREQNGKRRACYIGPITGYDLVAKMYDLEMQHAFNLRHRLQIFVSLLDFFLDVCEENEKDDVCREFRVRLKSALKEMEGDSNE